MNAPESRRRLTRSGKAKRRRTKAYLAEIQRQCRLANMSDRRDNWQQYIHLPE
jgi:hypothetical protein